MTIKADELRKQIYYIVFDCHSGKVEAILQAFHAAGGVMLAEGKGLPQPSGWGSDNDYYLLGYKYGQGDMLNGGYRLVEPLIEPNPVSS